MNLEMRAHGCGVHLGHWPRGPRKDFAKELCSIAAVRPSISQLFGVTVWRHQKAKNREDHQFKLEFFYRAFAALAERTSKN